MVVCDLKTEINGIFEPFYILKKEEKIPYFNRPPFKCWSTVRSPNYPQFIPCFQKPAQKPKNQGKS